MFNVGIIFISAFARGGFSFGMLKSSVSVVELHQQKQLESTRNETNEFAIKNNKRSFLSLFLYVFL